MFKKLAALASALGLTAFAGYSFFQRLEPYQTERFDLTAGPAAAEGYPMEIVGGRFTTSDGKGFVVSPVFLEGDWGSSSTTYVSGNGPGPQARFNRPSAVAVGPDGAIYVADLGNDCIRVIRGR